MKRLATALLLSLVPVSCGDDRFSDGPNFSSQERLLCEAAGGNYIYNFGDYDFCYFPNLTQRRRLTSDRYSTTSSEARTPKWCWPSP